MKNIENKNDAFGYEILAHNEGERVIEIIERSDGLIDANPYGIPLYFSEIDSWCETERKAIKFVKGKTLDLGCGAGRVSLYLQGKGIDTVGIDNSPLAIKVCKKRGVNKAKALPIEKLSELKEQGFQAVTMFGNNFGLFGTPKRAKRILKSLEKLTTDDAVILAQSLDVTQTKDKFHLKYQRERKALGKLPGELRLRCRYKNIIGPWFDYLMVSPKQMKAVLKDTNWKVSEFIHKKNSPGYTAVIIKK